jgi:diaminohydroxyphosphoribosylaminopyrimidine deaminase/5-amino-6-(5-phosphoribosylamino)uracil reductase
VAAAFVTDGCVDQVIGYVAPVLLGSGLSMIGAINAATLSDAVRFAFDDVQMVGEDMRWTARLSQTPKVELEGVG